MAYLVTQSNNIRQSYQVTNTCQKPRIGVKVGTKTSYVPLVPLSSTYKTSVSQTKPNIVYGQSRAALYTSQTSLMSTASSKKTTGITYVTRASTSGTSYGTKVSTTNTSYGTKVSTTNTVIEYFIVPSQLSKSSTVGTIPTRYFSQVISTWNSKSSTTTYGASGYKGEPIYNTQTMTLMSGNAITMYPQLRMIVPESKTKTTIYTSLLAYTLATVTYTNQVNNSAVKDYLTKQVTTTTHYDTKVVTTGTTYQTRASTSSTKQITGTNTVTTGTTYLTRKSTMSTLYGVASTASSTSLKTYSSYF